MTCSAKKPKTAFSFAFTEQGVAVLRGKLNIAVAIHVTIAIMRTFVMTRKNALEYKEFNDKLLEKEIKMTRRLVMSMKQ